MGHILDYIDWRGDLTFGQSPFNLVDNLVLSCLGYVVLDGLVSGFDCPYSISVAETAELFVQLPKPVKNLRDPKDETLLVAIGHSNRFGALQLMYYEEQLDREAEKQFAAITIALGNGSHYVAYRGTDFSVTGWKEDFNMTFRSGVPAQLEAVRYLRQVAERTTGPLYVGGHSKGGNLAAFAASFVEPEIQERIVAVYNNDGPGFLEDVFESAGYRAICQKIRTFIPQTSLFGMMLEHAEQFTIVQSSRLFLMQHDPYSWVVQGPDFVYVEQVTANSRFLDHTIRGWLASLPAEQREQFVDAIYEMIAVEKADTLQDLAKNWVLNSGDIVKTLRGMDGETAEMIRRTLKLLAQNIGRSAQTMILTEPAAMMQPLKEKLEQRPIDHTWKKLPQLLQKIEKQPVHHVIGRHK